MEINKLVLGPLQTNTYLLSIDDEVILIDPASKAEKLIEIIGDRKLLAILLTHGHFDHIKAVDGLYKQYGCPIYLHKDDEKLARDKSDAFRPSGVRLGTPAMTTRGLGIPEMALIAGWMKQIALICQKAGDEAHLSDYTDEIKAIRKEVKALALRFPIPGV